MNAASNAQLEALALNYLSFAFTTAVSNVWITWIAVVTAAVSFWKIRAAGGTGPAKSQHPDSRINEPVAAVSKTTAAVNFVLETDDSGNEGKRRFRRGKFAVCYDDSIDGVDGDSTAVDGGEGRCNWGGEWERGLKMRAGEDASLGWYRCQALPAIDGNVVRLWDWGCNINGNYFTN